MRTCILDFMSLIIEWKLPVAGNWIFVLRNCKKLLMRGGKKNGLDLLINPQSPGCHVK